MSDISRFGSSSEESVPDCYELSPEPNLAS